MSNSKFPWETEPLFQFKIYIEIIGIIECFWDLLQILKSIVKGIVNQLERKSRIFKLMYAITTILLVFWGISIRTEKRNLYNENVLVEFDVWEETRI